MSVTVPLAVVLPDVPVTVIVYVPAVVGAVIASQCATVPFLPQAVTPPARDITRSRRANHALQRRRRGTAINMSAASAAPPGTENSSLGAARVAVTHPPSAIVEMVIVAIPAFVPVMLTGLVAPKPNVGRLMAPLGEDVIAADGDTLPVKPPVGVTVIVDVFPDVAPGCTVTDEPPMVNPAEPLADVTVTEE